MSAANESMPFTIGAEDYAALTQWWLRHRPRQAVSWGMCAVLVFVQTFLTLVLFLALVGIYHIFFPSPVPFRLFGALAGVVWVSVLIGSLTEWWWPTLFGTYDVRLTAGPAGPMRFRVAPEGLVCMLEGSFHEYAWRVVSAFAATPARFFLVVDDRPVTVPRRAFVSDEHYREFAALAEQYRQQALTATPGPSDGAASAGDATRTQG
jgi:energy-coupling factor transporter transmembrane protein EcfT